jgi:hypothetical protein
MVMRVSLMDVLQSKLLVRCVHVGHVGMAVLVLVCGCKVPPIVALARRPVVHHVRVAVGVHHRVVGMGREFM